MNNQSIAHHLYIIEIVKSFFVPIFREQMESGIRDFWKGDRLVASPENSHFWFLI